MEIVAQAHGKNLKVLGERRTDVLVFMMGGGLSGAGDDLEENCRTFRRLVGG
jgi:hypothetical protein